MDDNYFSKLSPIIRQSLQIIASNEGSYHSVNPYDGYASSIGILQWNGPRAKKLLLLIVEKNKELAKSILSETSILEDLTKDNLFWGCRRLNQRECARISRLLTSPEGIEAQYELLETDITGYINHGKKLGISDSKALIFFADLENQLGYDLAEQIVKDISAPQELNMLNLLTASYTYCSGGKRIRRTHTYLKIMNLNV